jgi:hypothetical protein
MAFRFSPFSASNEDVRVSDEPFSMLEHMYE